MILPDVRIELLARQRKLIEPYSPEQLQPASYDCKLSSTFRVFDLHDCPLVDMSDPASFRDISRRVVGDRGRPFILHPGEFALGSTLERFALPHDIAGRVEGKSSLGRLGLLTHVTAGFIDPGFVGDITLEFVNLLRVPIALHPGMLVCQISFTSLSAKVRAPYKGRYQHTFGAVASRYGEDLNAKS